MNEFAEFREQIDKDEAAATEAARDGHAKWRSWWQNPGMYAGTADIKDEELTSVARVGTPVVDHIVRHDPARVLREVAAKRAILAEYERDPQADDQYLAGLAFALERLADADRA